MDEKTLQDGAKKELRRLKKLLAESGVKPEKISILQPSIENTAWMKVKLDAAREEVGETGVTEEYDNGGGQKGVKESPFLRGYEALWKAYLSGMKVLMDELPKEAAKAEIEKTEQKKNVLEIVRNRHGKAT